MDFETKIRTVLEKLEDYSETHPIIYSMWKKYIHKKVISIEETLDNCERAMESMNNSTDVTFENLLLLQSMFNLNATEI